jgi:hypothetical protein
MKKTPCYWKKRHINEWNRLKDSEINSCIYSQLILNKGAKNIHCRKDSSSTDGARKTKYSHVED